MTVIAGESANTSTIDGGSGSESRIKISIAKIRGITAEGDRNSPRESCENTIADGGAGVSGIVGESVQVQPRPGE